MSMSLAAFAESFANQKQQQRDRKERDEMRAMNDRMLGIMEQQISAGHGMGAAPEALSYDDAGRGPGGAAPTSSIGAASDPGSFSTGGGLFDLLDAKEGAGSYDTLYGHAQNKGAFAGTKVSNMTLGEVMDFTSPSGAYAQHVKGQVGRVATPVGRGQIVGTTLRRTAEQMGLDPSTPFNAKTQDAMINHLAANRLRGAKDMAGKMAGLRAEWEGFKSVPDAQLSSAITGFERQHMGGGMGARRPVSL